MPGFQSTRLVTEGALEPFFFLYTDDSIQGNPETCKQSSIMLNYEVKNTLIMEHRLILLHILTSFLHHVFQSYHKLSFVFKKGTTTFNHSSGKYIAKYP